ncbi:MAG: hypothetical protein P8R39_05240 [Alphaproteobacteria bacterium]|nr:hypothetical protein [Alphaproteobacteria bacterium]
MFAAKEGDEAAFLLENRLGFGLRTDAFQRFALVLVILTARPSQLRA